MSVARAITNGLRLATVLVALCSVVLCACRPQGEKLSADGRIQIEYWDKWTGFELEAMRVIVDRYNASQDRVYVNFVSHSQIDRKLLLATAGGNPPDIAGFWSHSVVSYAEKGVLYPLDRLMERDGLSRADYVPSVIDGCVYRDHVWGLPTTPATVALHYNRAMLREIGRDPDDPPRTLEELHDVAMKMTIRESDGSYSRMGFLPTDPGWWGPFWGFFFGGELISEDGRKITCDSPENVAAFTWFRSWIEEAGRRDVRLFEAAHRGQFASPSNSFMSGRIGMQQQGTWMANFIKEFGGGMEWGACAMPSASNVTGGPATIVETDMLVIPRGARHVEEAWAFIRYTQEQRNMEDLVRGQGKFSPLREVSRDFVATHPNPAIAVFRQLAESPNARAVPKTPVWTEYRDELADAIMSMWLTPESELSTAEALGRVRARMQPKLDTAWERWDTIGEQRLAEWSEL